ncbi:hypothetical protein N6H18_03830 [Reichenbachiella agarivorans]|uniref:Colicin import membrane protein n=1 Tax=Reichenbachiella agarivorans TaxID=2979464 RepID=A0ABY6CRE7_9BACT|nr:hypothetical protein [Reichenbachiella agarivorans]UXP33084.1 hypothetical protein N6H18_03830 [Reichenbachiella agarivorans]
MFKSIGAFISGIFTPEPKELIVKISKANQEGLYKSIELAKKVAEEQKRHAILAEKRAIKQAAIDKKLAEKKAKLEAKEASKKAALEAKAAQKAAKLKEKEAKQKA